MKTTLIAYICIVISLAAIGGTLIIKGEYLLACLTFSTLTALLGTSRALKKEE